MSYEKQNFTSGQVLTAAALNHMEDGIANAGGVTSWNDLEDKPFSATTEMVEILPEQSVTGGLEGDIYGSTFADEIKAGVRYDTIINGTKYTDVGKTVTVESMTGSYIGNLSLAPFFAEDVSDTGEPFVVVTAGGEGSIIWGEELGETIALAIYEVQEVVEKLDPKFLPEELVIVHEERERTVTCNMTLYDFIQLTEEARFALKGRVVVFHDNPYDLYFYPVKRVIYNNENGSPVENPLETAVVVVEYASGFFEITKDGIRAGVPV